MLTLRFEKHKACFFVAAGLPQPMRQKRGWIGVWQYGIVWRKGSRLSSTSRRCRRGERLDCKVPVPFGCRLDVALIMTLRCFLPCSGLFLETIVLLFVALTSSDWGPVILLPPVISARCRIDPSFLVGGSEEMEMVDWQQQETGSGLPCHLSRRYL